uniref:Uncharacterized protein n=1 Tax=Ascaris lumbricoides TaxID=6252 RepID=A0A9J2PRL2_ASCLU
MIKVNEKAIYDITTNERLFTIKLLHYREQIQCSLYFDYGHRISGKPAGQMSPCLILLTNFGRVMFVNVIDGSVEAIFILPTEIFRYRKICWCKARTSFAVFGETKKPLRGDFGFANDIGAFSEFLILFSRQPHRVIAYNIGDFPLQVTGISSRLA